MKRDIETQNKLVKKYVYNDTEVNNHMNSITIYGVKSDRKNAICNEWHTQTFHHVDHKHDKIEMTEDNKRDLIDFVVNNKYDLFRVTVYHNNLFLSNWDTNLLNKELIIKKSIEYMNMLNKLELK